MVEACRGVRAPGGKNGAQTVVHDALCFFFAVDASKRALVEAKNLSSGSPSQQDRRLVFGFATPDSGFISRSTRDEKVFAVGKTRLKNATFLAIESEACATSTRAGVLCGVSRRSRTMSLTNVTEDLSGLSRAELVYKAKLAEQAERCVRPLLVSISAFPPSRVARGRRTEENLSSGAPGPDIRGSDLGSGEPSAPPRSHGTTRLSFASPSPAAPRIEPRARLAGPDLARDHTVSSRIARIVNSNRDISSSAAPGDDTGALARAGARGTLARGLATATKPRPAAARRPPPRLVRHREAVPPRGPARLGTRRSVNARDNRRFAFFFVCVVFSRGGGGDGRRRSSSRRRSFPFVARATHRTLPLPHPWHLSNDFSRNQLRRDDGVHVQGG